MKIVEHAEIVVLQVLLVRKARVISIFVVYRHSKY